MKYFIKIATSIVLFFTMSMSVHAYSVTGTVLKIAAENLYVGGCMVQLSKPIGNGCTGNWVSLDCQEKYSSGGDRKYSTAMLGFSLNKSVTVYYDAKQKHGTTCVAKRLDVLQ